MSAGTPGGVDDVTGRDAETTAELVLPEIEEPNLYVPVVKPPFPRRFIHSWWFYAPVIGLLPITLLLLSYLADWHLLLLVPALLVTTLCALLHIIRYHRGSVLEIEARQLTERHAYYAREKLNPKSLAITPSYRIKQRLEAGEYVVWEFRTHPISLIALWWRHIFHTKIGPRAASLYVICMFVLFGRYLVESKNSPHVFDVPFWMSSVFAALPMLYFGYTIVEWWTDRYALTNRRFMAVVGLIKNDFGDIPRDRMQDRADTTTGPAHVLSWLGLRPYGTITFETSGRKLGSLGETTRFVSDVVHRITMHRPRNILK